MHDMQVIPLQIYKQLGKRVSNAAAWHRITAACSHTSNCSLLLALMPPDRGCLIKKQTNNSDKKTVLGASPDEQLHLMKVLHVPTLMRLS